MGKINTYTAGAASPLWAQKDPILVCDKRMSQSQSPGDVYRLSTEEDFTRLEGPLQTCYQYHLMETQAHNKHNFFFATVNDSCWSKNWNKPPNHQNKYIWSSTIWIMGCLVEPQDKNIELKISKLGPSPLIWGMTCKNDHITISTSCVQC